MPLLSVPIVTSLSTGISWGIINGIKEKKKIMARKRLDLNCFMSVSFK
jgi:hypothetical protein